MPNATLIDKVKSRNPLRWRGRLDASWSPYLDRLADTHVQLRCGRHHPFDHPNIEDVDRGTVVWMRLRLRYELRARTIVKKLESARLRAGTTWNGQVSDPAVVVRALQMQGTPVLFAELSPFAGRYFLDHMGVNGASSLQSVAPEQIAPYADETALFEAMRGAYAGRGEGGGPRADPKTLPRYFVFAPLQVPLDTQMLLHGGPVRRQSDYLRLLGQVSLNLPSGYALVVKPHPETPYKDSYLREIMGPRVVIGRHYGTRDLLERCVAVVTVNSSVGPDAFLFDKPVIAFGRAPWIKPALAQKVENVDEMCRAILSPPAVVRTLRQRFLAHWYHAYTFPADGEPDEVRAFVESKIALAKSRSMQPIAR